MLEFLEQHATSYLYAKYIFSSYLGLKEAWPVHRVIIFQYTKIGYKSLTEVRR